MIQISILLKKGALEGLDVPFLSIFLGNTLAGADVGVAVLATGNTAAGALENDVEVHTVDTDITIVLKTKIDVFLDTKTKVTFY